MKAQCAGATVSNAPWCIPIWCGAGLRRLAISGTRRASIPNQTTLNSELEAIRPKKSSSVHDFTHHTNSHRPRSSRPPAELVTQLDPSPLPTPAPRSIAEDELFYPTTMSPVLRNALVRASQRSATAALGYRAASTHAISNPTLANIEKRWEGMPMQEQAELWMALRDRMKGSWTELTVQEKKAGKWQLPRNLPPSARQHRVVPATSWSSG